MQKKVNSTGTQNNEVQHDKEAEKLINLKEKKGEVRQGYDDNNRYGTTTVKGDPYLESTWTRRLPRILDKKLTSLYNRIAEQMNYMTNKFKYQHE